MGEALERGKIAGLDGYPRIRSEVRYGKASRVDFLLEGDSRPSCFLEVKNVHMMRKPRRAEFPDAVTERGAKHLDELAREAKAGARSVLLFLVQIGSAENVSLARDIDPAYGKAFDRARDRGGRGHGAALSYFGRWDRGSRPGSGAGDGFLAPAKRWPTLRSREAP